MNVMAANDESLPKVSLTRSQRVRLILVGIFVAMVAARVTPDIVRLFIPLGVFGYATDANAVIVKVPETGVVKIPYAIPTLAARLQIGDRVRIDRIKPFDRKPGIAGTGYTRENFDRKLPIERDHKELLLAMRATREPIASRLFTLARIVVFVASLSLGAILFLIKPGYATGGFFAFCIGGEAPTTYFDQIFDPWYTEVPQWIGHTIQGGAGPALLLFALGLIVHDNARERTYAIVAAIVGLLMGTLNAYVFWLLHYGARPALTVESIYTSASTTITVATAIVLLVAYLRAKGRLKRARAAWIGGAFAFAGIAHLISQRFYPTYLPFWVNGILVSMTIVPIVVVWIAVVRSRFFNVDFVVSKAIVYVAITAAVIGVITVSEEVLTYLFYNNTDIAYGFIIVISLAIGSFTGKIRMIVDRFVDRFIFRDRHAQQQALELIAGYILDSETVEDVYRALLQDAAHALKLTFGGILARQTDGSYRLSQSHAWPDDCEVTLGAGDALTLAIARTRAVLNFSGKETSLIRDAFPNERLTFAAPIFFDRSVAAIVVYGHNISGLDLDPQERELLVRVVAHASIALNSIELARYRKLDADGVESLAIPAV